MRVPSLGNAEISVNRDQRKYAKNTRLRTLLQGMRKHDAYFSRRGKLLKGGGGKGSEKPVREVPGLAGG